MNNFVRRAFWLVLFLFPWVLQQASPVTVATAKHPEYGTYLVDGQGRALYLYTRDSKDNPTCYDQCAQTWPPLLVRDKAVAGQGVAPNLLGTVRRKDGGLQVTYNGWPLYYYARDQKPGDTNGQGVGGVWFLVSPYGVAIKPRQEAAQTPIQANLPPGLEGQLMAEGQTLFSTHCAACHGDRGQGGAGPALAGNAKLQDATFVMTQVLIGSRFMPPFGDKLSDHQIAAVLTYIRNSWGNRFGPISEEMVKARRQAVQGR